MYKYNLELLRRLCSLVIASIVSVMILVSPASAEVNPESIIQIFQRLEILEKKSRELTGENEVLKNQLEQMKKVQKQGFLNVDEQIDEMRESLKAKVAEQTKPAIQPAPAPEVKPTAPTTPVIKTPPVTPAAKDKTPAQQAVEKKETPNANPKTVPVTVTTDGVKTIPATAEEKAAASTAGKTRAPSAYEKETYQAAFNKMSASPTAATQAFKEYIKLQPDSPLAANAQYWIGEIMYSHNNYKGAVQEFIKVLQQYKSSNKAPDAAIKLGYSFYALKNWTYARRTFEDVLKYFPGNENAVSLATKRLEKMKAAGN